MKIEINKIVVANRMRHACEDKVSELAKSIEKVGLLQPICIDNNNNLVAGLHRLEAIKKLGLNEIECNVLTFENSLMQRLAEIDENLVRSELTVLEVAEWQSERKKVYEELYPETKRGLAGAIAKHNPATAESAVAHTPNFVESTANLTNKSNRVIFEEIQIAEKILPEVKAKIHGTELANQKTNLIELARLDTDKQKNVIDKLIENPNQSVKEVIAEQKKEIRKAEIEKQRVEIENNELPKLQGLFDVVSVDPPWPYEQGKSNSYDPDGRRVANPYPEMSIEEIKSIELPLTENAVVFLWTTHAFLRDSFDILDSWGLKYKATMVWDKVNMGMGATVRMQCEFCLIAFKGKPFFSGSSTRDIIREQRREHSRKPEEFFEMVKTVCAGRKLEYFSRQKRDGWEVFGNDTAKF